MRLCRYRYGNDRCAHGRVEDGRCHGERNCLERSAPSYHAREPSGPAHWLGLYSPEHRRFYRIGCSLPEKPAAGAGGA